MDKIKKKTFYLSVVFSNEKVKWKGLEKTIKVKDWQIRNREKKAIKWVGWDLNISLLSLGKETDYDYF